MSRKPPPKSTTGRPKSAPPTTPGKRPTGRPKGTKRAAGSDRAEPSAPASSPQIASKLSAAAAEGRLHKPPGVREGSKPCTQAHVRQAEKLCQHGLTDQEVADVFEISLGTLKHWKAWHPEFADAMRAGKDIADQRVVRSLYARAVGYDYQAVKIFMPAGAEAPVYAEYTEHVPPDVTACIYWTKNRLPHEWRDQRKVEHSGTVHTAQDLTDEQLADIIRASGPGADASEGGQGGPDQLH